MRNMMWVGLAGLIAGLSLVLVDARADEPVKRHAQSLIGEPKYGPGFKSFDWVNPSAPKGGTVRMSVSGSFDSLNAFSVKGNPAGGLGMIYDALFEGSLDEPATEYGLVAEWMSYPDDFSSVTFGLRPAAHFHDGEPIKPEDVIFSLDALKAAHPLYGQYWKNIVKAEKTGEHEVKFTFDVKGNRELPNIAGQVSVLPKHYWTAKGSNGEVRDLSKSTLDVPLGSGPYKIKEVDPTRGITYERVKDYWAKDLPVQAGQNNFDEIKFTYFRDRLPAFEAFKTGSLDYWQEDSASRWATQYEFDALKKGLVKKELIPAKRITHMQAFALNTRRAKFQDIRVRKALNLVYNFEEANKKLFYESYTRTRSFFERSELEASGLPQGRELEILTGLKDQVPPEVFTAEYKNPVNTPENRRANLSEAGKLLAASGWTNKNGTLVNAAGEEFSIEFLIDNETFQKVLIPYIEDLKLVGIKGSIRTVDVSQYKRRTDTFEYDVVVDTFLLTTSPGNEQRDYWSSAAADKTGSQNSIGIKNPAIDKIIDLIIFAKDRADLVAATRALDRVLLWNSYVIPQWHLAGDRVVTWDIFGRPEKLPGEALQGTSFLKVWWVDPAKQAALDAARGKS